MLSVVDKLIRHVESSQLTSDLGGFLPYNHEEWIELRLVSLCMNVQSLYKVIWYPTMKSCGLPAKSCDPPASHVILLQVM